MAGEKKESVSQSPRATSRGKEPVPQSPQAKHLMGKEPVPQSPKAGQ
jgi:hypothetical protein